MTQILGVVTRGRAFHVSDRLVTRKTGYEFEEYDVLSNKTVVFGASNAIVTIGYSGQAFIEGLPTDSWIAKSLIDLPEVPESLMWRPSRELKWPSIGEALERLRHKAESELSRSTIDQSIAPKFSVVGWSWKTFANNRTLGYPLLCEIEIESSSTYSIKYSAKHWAWDRRFTLQTNPDLAKGELDHLMSEIKGKGGNSPMALQDALVQSIRRISTSRADVGRDVMCVLLTPRSSPVVRVTYSPEDPQRYYAHKTPKGQTLLGDYAPWIMISTCVWPPSATSSGWTDMPSSFSWSLSSDPIPNMSHSLIDEAPTSSAFATLQKRPTFKPKSR